MEKKKREKAGIGAFLEHIPRPVGVLLKGSLELITPCAARGEPRFLMSTQRSLKI